MFPLILTVLNPKPYTLNPIKGCQYKGENPKFYGYLQLFSKQVKYTSSP